MKQRPIANCGAAERARALAFRETQGAPLVGHFPHLIATSSLVIPLSLSLTAIEARLRPNHIHPPKKLMSIVPGRVQSLWTSP